jgi:hypothetical protein
VRLVFDLSGQDRLPIFRLHFHTFEGRGLPVGELASHHYAVDRNLALLAHHPFSSARLIARYGALTNRLGTAYADLPRTPSMRSSQNFPSTRWCETSVGDGSIYMASGWPGKGHGTLG